MTVSQCEGSRSSRLPLSVGVIFLFLIVALVSRWRILGDPIVTGVDEQFYMLVAERMLHGATLYVDIWDRKPIGLFLIYAAGGLFGNVVLGSQIIALGAVVGTGFLLYRLALRTATTFAAAMVGLIYIVFLTLAGGEGGQAPVYYNLLVTAAMAVYVRAREKSVALSGDLRRGGALAMLLFGLALQVKYTVLFEGVFLGLVLLYTAWKRGRGLPALSIDAGIWVGSALAPTALVGLCYAVAGHWEDWLFANFISIGMRTSEPMDIMVKRVIIIMVLVAPLICGMLLRWVITKRPRDSAKAADLRFLDGWAGAAGLGVALFGTWFGHYALALFGPFALTLAPLGRKPLGRIFLVLLFAYGLVAGQVLSVVHAEQRGDIRLLQSATAAVQGQRNCLFIFDGPTYLYETSHSCLPSSRPFPENLRTLNERGAVGLNEIAELRRIMAARPDRVMLRTPAAPEDNPATHAVLADALQRDYVLTWRYPVQGRDYVIYSRRDSTSPVHALADARQIHAPQATCRAPVPPPWTNPIDRLVWYLAPIMGSCI